MMRKSNQVTEVEGYPATEQQDKTMLRHARRRLGRPMTQGDIETIAQAQWKRERRGRAPD